MWMKPFTIGICLIIFVQRVFEICLLYLASPYFVCMIPLDDGEKFSRWREMFVGKCFTGFGSVVGMRLFLMICPIIMGNNITFGNEASPEMTYMIKLFFIAGGAWAVYKSGPMITSLISSQAGSSEASTAATVGGMLYAYTAGKMISKGQQLLRSPLGGTTRERKEESCGFPGDSGAGRSGRLASGLCRLWDVWLRSPGLSGLWSCRLRDVRLRSPGLSGLWSCRLRNAWLRSSRLSGSGPSGLWSSGCMA